jgi:hypothetical protein
LSADSRLYRRHRINKLGVTPGLDPGVQLLLRDKMDAPVKPGHDSGVHCSRMHYSQIQFSNSPRASTHIQTDVIHRPCYLVGVGSAVISLPSPA